MSKQTNWIRSLPRKNNVFFLAVVPTTFVAFFLYPISQSGLSGDDIPNSMRSAVLQTNGWTRWEFIKLAIIQWKNNEGRFFPISTIENVFIFDLIHSVFLYKFLQLFITIALIILAAAFIAKLLGSWRIFPLAIFVTLSCLQTRNWYDPTLGFGLLLQSVQIKILFCLYGVVNFLRIEKRRAYFYFFGSALLWVMALLQYEVVVTLIPTLVIFVFLFPGDNLRKKFASGLFVAITSIYIWSIFQLRAGVSASAAYTINSDLGTVTLTYLKQVSGGIPFSAIIWSRGAESPVAALIRLPFFLGLVLVATIVLSAFFRSSLVEVTNRLTLILFIIGINFCFGPAITTALSVRWQNELAWGLSYLSVSFVYTGIAFISISAIIFILKASRGIPLVGTILFGLFVGIFALSAVSNHALLDINANATKHMREQRDLYDLAIREGFFSLVPDNSVVIYPSFNENFWINGYFTEWLGGPDDLVFVQASEDARKKCNSNLLFVSCPKSFYLEYKSTNTSKLILSLSELDSKTYDSHLSHRFFGQHISVEDLKTICPNPTKNNTKKGKMFSCRES